MDAEEAAGKGIPLTLATLVEDHFTHQMSVNLHLDLISLTREGEAWGTRLTDVLWTNLVSSTIPEVKSIILSWLCNNRNLIGNEARCTLARDLSSCDDDDASLPEYADAIDVFPEDLLFSWTSDHPAGFPPRQPQSKMSHPINLVNVIYRMLLSILLCHFEPNLLLVGSHQASFLQVKLFSSYRVFFFHWASPKKLKYGKPRLGESTLT